MSNEKWKWIALVILGLMLFGNRKVCLWRVVKEQLLTFRNAKKKRFSPWDFICFILFPIVASLIIVYKLNFSINATLAGLLTTIFSIVFTVLFGFASVLISKIESDNKIESRVAGETFVSIVSSTILSLIATILSIILTEAEMHSLIKALSAGLLSVALISIMLLLMVTKRTFLLYIEHKSK